MTKINIFSCNFVKAFVILRVISFKNISAVFQKMTDCFSWLSRDRNDNCGFTAVPGY